MKYVKIYYKGGEIKMFRIINSGRQSGATTYLIKELYKDYINDEVKLIGIVSTTYQYPYVIRGLSELHNKSIFNKSKLININTYYDLIGIREFDKFYIFSDFENVSTDILDKLQHYDLVMCDKILSPNPINKTEYDLAKYWIRNKNMNNEELDKFYKICSKYNIHNIRQLTHKNIVKYDVEFLDIDNSFKIVDRIDLINTGYLSDNLLQGIFYSNKGDDLK
jgi:hypothetical protein